MKNGYNAVSNADEELQPLNIKNQDATKPQVPAWLKAALATAAVAIICWMVSFQRPSSTNTDTTTTVLVPKQSKTILSRPFCMLVNPHNNNNINNIKLLQTSMKQPSLQFAEQPCVVAATDKSSRNQADSTSSVYLNTFGAPDARLQVNFSQIAFPQRDIPIQGFGGAFTEAAARNFKTLSKQGQDAVIELLFGKSGVGYTIGRFHMNSCDFSTASYSFDETKDDFELKEFDVGVQHDVRTGIVDMALQAVSKSRQSWGSIDPKAGDNITVDGDFMLYASPWSPPSWMKKPTWQDLKKNPNATTAAAMTYSAQPNCLKQGVGPNSQYARSWALYFAKYISAYKNLGLPLDMVTVQNEPEFPAPWEACAYSPQAQQDFVTYHLGPVLRKHHPDVKILIFDHNKDHVITWVDELLRNTSQAKQYISGTAYHWYAGGMDRLLDGALGIPNMHRLQDKLKDYGVQKDHLVLGSESCHCPTTGYAGGDINIYWSRAERYAHTILADLAAGSNGWVEWNFILDGIGGPNHLGNLCESSLLAVPHRALDANPHMAPLPDFEPLGPMGNVSMGDGRTREELNALGFPAKYLDVGVAVQPMFFYMAHISRYVRPGSRAVMGLVEASLGPDQIFSSADSVVMGGGQNELARNGIELTAWPCEGSTRQQFKWDVENYHRQVTVFGHDWKGKPTRSCVGRQEDKDLLGLRLTSCASKENQAGKFDVLPVPNDDYELPRYYIRLLNPAKGHVSECLVIRDLHNNGGAYGQRGGAQVTLGSCEHESAKWIINKESGEASSLYFANQEQENRVCITTGWPFLQMGAFLTPNGESSKTVVILNEANDPANFALQDGKDVVLTASIPPRSIQTVLMD